MPAVLNKADIISSPSVSVCPPAQKKQKRLQIRNWCNLVWIVLHWTLKIIKFRCHLTLT